MEASSLFCRCSLQGRRFENKTSEKKVMGIPTSSNPTPGDFSKDGQIKPPQIEFLKNNPATTKHLPLPNSSWLQSMSYDAASKRLTVNTKSGASWQHSDIDANQFSELQISKSVGSYYTRNIKGQAPIVHIKKIAKVSDYPARKEPHAKIQKLSNKVTSTYAKRYR